MEGQGEVQGAILRTYRQSAGGARSGAEACAARNEGKKGVDQQQKGRNTKRTKKQKERVRGESRGTGSRETTEVWGARQRREGSRRVKVSPSNS